MGGVAKTVARCTRVTVLALTYVLAMPVLAQDVPDEATPGTPSAERDTTDKLLAKIVQSNRKIDVDSDGGFTASYHTEVLVLRKDAIDMLGQQPVTYSERTQTVTIKDAYTLKPDGRKLAVREDAIITRAKSTANSSRSFGDLMEKVVIYPNVEVGDRLVSDTVYINKPTFPGHYTFTKPLSTVIVIDSEISTITAPKTLPLFVDTQGVTVKKSVEGDRIAYTYTYANPRSKPDDDDFISRLNRGPHVFVSTYKDYRQFAAVYADMINGKEDVTADIQAKADEIVADTTDRRETARKIYEWVAAHIRYVAQEFGIGGVVPHDAAVVLRDGYGDCKDHAVLFSALLKAKGIDSQLVLVSSGSAYALTQYPTPSQFNHMISYLPEFGIYADTTPIDQPFGSLQFFEYGKPVVRIRTSGNPTATIPPLKMADSGFEATAHLTLNAEGMLSGEIQVTMRGPVAAELRRLGLRLSSSPSKAAVAVLKSNNLPAGKGSLHFPQGTDLSRPYTYDGAYTVQDQQRLLSGKPFVLPHGLNLLDVKSSHLLGPIAMTRFKKADAVACHSGSASDDIALEFPVGKKIAELPKDVTAEEGGLRFISRWAVKGNTVSVHRELKADFKKPLCEGSQRRAVESVLAKVREDYQAEIALTDAKEEQPAE